MGAGLTIGIAGSDYRSGGEDDEVSLATLLDAFVDGAAEVLEMESVR